MWLQVLTGGFMNQMRVYHVTPQPESPDAFVVRLYGVAPLSFLGNRDTEFIAMQVYAIPKNFIPINLVEGSSPEGKDT